MYKNLNVEGLGISGRQGELIELTLTYGFRGFDFDLVVSVNHGDCRLIIDGCGWPSAWRLPPNTSAEAYDPDYGTDGRKEFDSFLAEIAPFLDETLIIQSIGSASGRFSLSACEWRVAPGASNVEKTEISSAEALPPLARASACPVYC